MALEPEDLKAIRGIISDVAHDVAGEVSKKQTVSIVHTTLKAMGMNTDEPFELQKDFAYLTQHRKGAQDTKKVAKDAIVRYTVTGVFAAFIAWLATNAPGSGPFGGQ